MILSFFQRILKEMIFPLMALYLSLHLGSKLAGILLIISVTLSILFNFIGGYISDILGRKKVILLSETISCISFLGMSIFNTELLFSPINTYIFFIFNNLFSSLSTPALNAMILDVSTDSNRKLIYSINYWIINLSISLGSIIGAILFYKYFFYVLLTATIVSLATLLIYAIFLKDTFMQPAHWKFTTSAKKMFSNYSYVFKNYYFMLFFIATLFVMAIEYQFTNIINVELNENFGIQKIDLYFIHFNISGIQMFSILRSESTLIVIFSSFIVYWLIKKWTDKLTINIGLFLFVLGYTTILVNMNIWVLITFMFILTIGELMYSIVSQSYLPKLIEENHRAKYMAFFSLSQKGGQLIASFILALSSMLSITGIVLLVVLMGANAMLLFNIIITKKGEQQ